MPPDKPASQLTDAELAKLVAERAYQAYKNGDHGSVTSSRKLPR